MVLYLKVAVNKCLKLGVVQKSSQGPLILFHNRVAFIFHQFLQQYVKDTTKAFNRLLLA